MRRGPATAVALLATLVCAIVARADDAGVGAGRRLYRDGVLVSGGPLAAVVAGDVPVSGTQLTCSGCHQRSGMGSSEGSANVPPVAGPLLFAATDGPIRRPAYDEASLGRAVRDGVDPSGRALGILMPRYRLSDDDVRALAAYLRTLSAGVAPGVTGDSVRFATVVADDAPPAARDAMLAVLDRFVADKNGETRQEPRRARVLGDRSASRGYRRWLLSRWTLHGAPATWRAQLEEQYRRDPVFALLSGIGAGDWRPVHDFCEQNEIPCLLPNTDVPAVDPDDYYTFYFSRGVALEADTVAAAMARSPARGGTLQVYRAGTAGEAAARTLRGAAGGRATITDLGVPGGPLPDGLGRRIAQSGATQIVLWLGPEDLGALGGDTLPPAATMYVSSTLLGERFAAVPAPLRARTRVAHPFVLPAERAATLARPRAWLASRGGGLTDERIQAQTYFACLLAGDALMHVRWFLSRDYVLDTIDHTAGLAMLPSYYPRAGFGPRQRQLAGGAYLLTLGGDGPEPIVTGATWMTVGR